MIVSILSDRPGFLQDHDSRFRTSDEPSSEITLPAKFTVDKLAAAIEEELDIDDECLWDSEEIEVLRDVFKAAKAQNNKLKAQLRVNQEELKKLKTKYKKQSNVLEVRTMKLQEATKANERLQLMSDSLKKQFNASNETVKFLHEEIAELRETQSKLSKEVHNLRLELDKERIDRKNVEFDLENQQRDALRQMELREEKLKLLHEGDINFLHNQVEELTRELEEEKKDHQRSLKGLQHLRNHFSGVSFGENGVQDSDKKANVVAKDQFKKWSYY